MGQAGGVHAERRILPPPTHQYDALASWMGAVLPAGCSLLEVGAGRGDAEYPPLIAPLVARWVGVDVDPAVERNPFLTEAHVSAIEHWVPNHPEQFDAAVAVYVLEHVARPEAFMRRMRAGLRPGGSFFALTPNHWHYFGAIADASARLRIEDPLLYRLRDDDLVDEYHFPVAYKLNSVPRLEAAAAGAGFSAVEIRHVDHPGVFADYFPDRLRWFPGAWSAAVHRLRLGRLMGTLVVRFIA